MTSRGVAVGYGNVVSHDDSIIIGSQLSSTATQQLILGHRSAGAGITNVKHRSGVDDATPVAVTISPTGGSGAAVAGAALNLSAGISGDAATAGGAINLQVALAGTGTTRTTAWQIANTGFLLAGSDGVYDIGAQAASRPRYGFSTALR